MTPGARVRVPVKVGLCCECDGVRLNRCWAVEFEGGYVAHQDERMGRYYLRLMCESAAEEVPS